MIHQHLAEACRDALMRFWGETLKIERAPRGLVLALPLMYPDGLQVAVHAELISDRLVLLSDRGEALVSIAHLLYRHEPEAASEDVADQAVQRFFRDRLREPKRNVLLEGELERGVRVDYYLPGKRSLALEVIDRKYDLLPYMEQWGWRWTDLRRKHADLIPAMVYDPHHQRWDEASLKIGRAVCEVFCPYFDNEVLDSALEKVG